MISRPISRLVKFNLIFTALFCASTVLGQTASPVNVQTYMPQTLNVQPAAQSLPQTAQVQQNAQIQQVTGVAAQVAQPQYPIGTEDPILGNRIARISNQLQEIPKEANQIWREFDISPYTKNRTFPTGTQPEQTIIDWIVRQTGTKIWHTGPFSILAANSERLYVYHTEEVMMEVADIVDRFVNPQFVNESYSIRVVSLSRPDWMTRGHQYLRPIPIITPGVQGWLLEKDSARLLLQELSRRNDFKEIAPPQFLIPDGVAHHVAHKKQRTYLRDVQANAAALNGYAEDRVTFDEGFGLQFVPLSVLDGQKVDAIIKLDIVQIEKMLSLMIDVPTAANPRQRVQIESPQVACFKLDEQIRWPKDKILLLDLGTIPLPETTQQAESSNGLFSGLKNLGVGSSTSRANFLLMIEHVAGVVAPAVPVNQTPVTTQGTLINGAVQPATNVPVQHSLGSNSTYWQGLR